MKETTVTTDTTTYPTTTDPAPSNGTRPSDDTAPSNGTGPAATTWPDRPAVNRPLGDFLPGGPAAVHLVVALPSGDQVVVVGRADDGQVEVWSFGGLTRRDADTAVSAVTDPAARDDLLAAAVRGLDAQRHTAIQRAARAVEDRDRERGNHEQVLTDIRAYAVDKHQDGEICRGGLNDFLTAFGLPEFAPRVRVRYTLTGSYEVDADDADAAGRDARGYLKPDLAQLDNVIDDSDTYSVHVDDVEELDT
jgi:hypothetical protein